MRVWRFTLALSLICAVIVGCSHVLNESYLTSFEPSSSIYEVERFPWRSETGGDPGEGIRATIEFTFTNAGNRAVYVPVCGSPHAPGLEKQVDGRWERVYSPVHLLCLESPLEIEPGATHEGTLEMTAGLPGSRLRPLFEADEINGTYRLHWRVYETSETNELIPLRDRVSTSFELRVDSN